MQSDETTEAIYVEPTTTETKDLTMSSILNNDHYPPYGKCINLVSDQDKSKDTIQLMEGHPVENQEATPLHMGLLYQGTTPMGRPQDKEATATSADINEGDTRSFVGDTNSHTVTATMAGLDEWLNKYMHDHITKQVPNKEQKEVT